MSDNWQGVWVVFVYDENGNLDMDETPRHYFLTERMAELTANHFKLQGKDWRVIELAPVAVIEKVVKTLIGRQAKELHGQQPKIRFDVVDGKMEITKW